jgi:hypothetical protein
MFNAFGTPERASGPKPDLRSSAEICGKKLCATLSQKKNFPSAVNFFDNRYYKLSGKAMALHPRSMRVLLPRAFHALISTKYV